MKKYIKQIFILSILFCFLVNMQDKNITVLAKDNKYTVVFNSNSGSGSMAMQKIEYAKATALNKCKFKKKGYIFRGWAKSKKGKVVYKDKQKVKNLAKAGKKIKLYAVWEPEPARRALILGETSTDAVPIADVTSMVSMMKSCTFSGANMNKVVKYNDHTKEEITKKIKSVFSKNKKTDVSYLYFTCHGRDDGTIRIGRDGEGYTPDELRHLLDQSVKGKVVILLDCCYSGNAIQSKSVSNQENNFTENFLNKFTGEKDTSNSEKGGELAYMKYRVLCSSTKDEVSYSIPKIASYATMYWELGSGWDEKENKKVSLFADKNKDKKITLKELYNYSYEQINTLENINQHICAYPENSSFVLFGRY